MKNKKDPSKAEVGPLSSQYQSAGDYGVVKDLPSGDPSQPPEEPTEDHEKAASAEGGAPEPPPSEPPPSEPQQSEQPSQTKEAASRVSEPQPASVPPDYQPTRSLPDLNKRKEHTDSRATDVPTHSGDETSPDTRKMIENRIDGLQEAQIDESGGEVLKQQVENQEASREQFLSYPTDTEVKRTDESHVRHSSYPSDTSRTSMPKSASEELVGELRDPEINPIRMMLILDRAWGNEGWTDWEPETIRETVRRHGFELPRENEDKVMALKVLRKQESFWESARVFPKICLAFNHRIVDWGHLQEPRMHAISATVTLVERYIRERPYDAEVKGYVAAAAIRDGFIMMPPSLSFARQVFYEKLVDTMGDEALQRQKKLMVALEEENPDMLDEDDVIQYVRLLRCQYHSEEMVNEVR